MAFETKAMLIAIGEIIRKADSTEEAYNVVAEMADADGIKLKPFAAGKTTEAKEAKGLDS